MLWATELLGPVVAKRLSQFDSGLWTPQQALDLLLADLAFTLSADPASRGVIAAVIGTLRPSVAEELVGCLRQRRSLGGWQWPPIRALALRADGLPPGQASEGGRV